VTALGPDDLVAQALSAISHGAWSEAAVLARELEAVSRDQPQTHWIAARVALGLGDLAGARVRLTPLAGDPRLSPPQRAEVLLRLSEALDGLGEPAAAFAAARAGKALQRQAFAARAASREDAVARFRRLAEWFRTTGPTPWRSPPETAPSPARSHVVLVGFPRSGTTLLEQALAGHADVVTLEEAPTLAAAHAQFMGSAADLDRLAHLTPAEAAHWRGVYWQAVHAGGVAPLGKVFVEKAPAGTLDLPLVSRLFPEAKILFALRDPRDVVLSCLRQDFQMNALTYAFTDLGATADAYTACMDMAETYRAVLPLDLLEVRHEALVDDFAGGLAAVCRHIGLTLDPQMLDIAATARGRSVLTPSAPQVRAGLNRKGLGRWRAYASELSPVLPRLAPWVERFGYPVD
jgi:hypothetical protein